MEDQTELSDVGDGQVEFVDEEFALIDKPAVFDTTSTEVNSPDPLSAVPLDDTLKAVAPPVQIVPEDTRWVVEIMLNLPTMWYDKLPERSPETIDGFNRALVKYCIKKNINVMDYLFDEMELLILGLGIFSGYKKDYKKYYTDAKKVKDTDELNLDHSHYAEVEEAKESKADKLNIDHEHYKKVEEAKNKTVEAKMED